jgi:hypothetical protein
MTGLSVVVICLDEERYIDECLDALNEAAERSDVPVEIIVVDGGSIDATRERVAAWASKQTAGRVVRLVASPAGYSRQRNVGVRKASHPWVAFVSSDVRVSPTWVCEIAPQLTDGVVLGIGRFKLVPELGGPDWLAPLIPTVYASSTEDPVVERCSSVHLVGHRHALLQHPFDEALAACEDKDLAFRLRREAPADAIVWLSSRPQHLARDRVSQHVRRLRREAAAVAALRLRHGPTFPDCFGWRSHARRSIMVLTAAIVATVALALTAPAWTATLPAVVWLIVANWHLRGRRRLKNAGYPALPLAALHMVSMMSIAVGYWIGWLLTIRHSLGLASTIAEVRDA